MWQELKEHEVQLLIGSLLTIALLLTGIIIGKAIRASNNTDDKTLKEFQAINHVVQSKIAKCNQEWMEGKLTDAELNQCYQEAYAAGQKVYEEYESQTQNTEATSDTHTRVDITTVEPQRSEHSVNILFEGEDGTQIKVPGLVVGSNCSFDSASSCTQQVKYTDVSKVETTVSEYAPYVCIKICSEDHKICYSWTCKNASNTREYVITIHNSGENSLTNMDLEYINWIPQYVEAIAPSYKLREMAEEMGQKYGCTNQICDIVATHEVLRKTLKYIPDPRGEELIKGPWETLRDGGGDCEDQAILFASFARSLGLKSGLALLVPKNPNQEGHAVSYLCVSPDHEITLFNALRRIESVPQYYLAFQDPVTGDVCWLVDLTTKAPIGSAIWIDPSKYKTIFIAPDGTAYFVTLTEKTP